MLKTISRLPKTSRDIHNWEDIPYQWVRRFNIVKMSKPPHVTDKFNTMPVKIPTTYFSEIENPF